MYKQTINKRLPRACNRSPGLKLLSITTQLDCGGHLGGRARLPDTILEEDHPMTIPSKFGSNWATGSRQDGFLFPIGSYVKLSTAVQPSWSEGGTTRHNFGRGPSNDYFIKVWFQLSNWFQTRRILCEFPIGSYVKLISAVGAILVEGPNRQTIF